MSHVEVGFGGLCLVLLIVVAAALLGPMLQRAAEAPPSISLPAAPAVTTWSIRTNWGEIELDVDGALDHAVDGHGELAEEALRMARRGQCIPYLPCGTSWQSLVDGTKGYFSCLLGDGRTWLVPFYADALLQRLVAMTAYAVRPTYVPRVRIRGDCAPVELISALLYGGEYEDDQ